jgi:hypothetical protein
MGVGGGAGNPISFSEIRDFYGDDKDQPVSLSEYNRGGDLVPQTFAGSQTATQNTDITYSNNQATFDDFQVNKSTGSTFSQGSTGSRVLRVSVSNGVAFVGAVGSYNVVASDALIFISGTGIRNEGQDVISTSGTFSTTGVIVDNSSYFQSRIYAGPAYQSGDENNFSGAAYGGPGNLISSSPCSTGTVTATSDSHNNGGTIQIYSARRTATTTFDVTLQNTSSTSTYTLTDGSTGTETVYSPGESQTILDDQLSEGWLVAYDKVTGSGAGSAGDIDVSVATVFTGGLVPSSGTTQRVHSNVTSGSSVSVTYTVTADDAAIFMNGGGFNNVGGEQEFEATGNHSATRNGSTLYTATAAFVSEKRYRGPASDGTEFPGNQFHGSLNAGDVIVVTATVGSRSGQATISSTRRAAQYKAVFTNSSGSESYTLEGGTGKTSGISSGSVVMSPGATRDATSPGSSTTPSWEIHFDTSSGDCNTNIPTTVSAGNPINMDLFNAPGTPVG